MRPIVEIKTYNPYEAIYPNRKLVNRETLILIKFLKNENIDVRLLPDDGRPVEYLFKKGIREFLTDPINVFLLNIPVTIFVNLFTNYVQKLLDASSSRSVQPTVNNTNIYIHTNQNNQVFNSIGEAVTDKQIRQRDNHQTSLSSEFTKRLKSNSPFIDCPTPILLEHNPYIIGWCSLKEDFKGLRLTGRITDDIAYKRIKQGRYKGLSITGISKKTVCTICNSNYIECIHISGTMYDGKDCSVHLLDADYIETSVVKEPVNQQCLLDLIQ